MTDKHDHGASDEECDWEILKLANEKGTFGIELGLVPCEHLQAAFDRGVDHGWWLLTDVTFRLDFKTRNPVRMFKLTSFGEARRAQLEKKYAKPSTH